MKLTIDSIDISEDNIEVILKLKTLKQEYSIRDDWDVRAEIKNLVVSRIAEQIILERGADILSQVNNNQLVNALIMKVAGKLGNND